MDKVLPGINFIWDSDEEDGFADTEERYMKM